MNDLDLRAALHRDADLVGEPSPDLLDQLVVRRRHQRRQRAGVLAVVAAVVVIAAGVPVGSTLLSRSEGSPATQAPTPTVEATPSVAEEPAETPAGGPTVQEDPAPTADVGGRPAPNEETPAAPQWPAAAEAVHGGEYWAVFLEVARAGTEQAELQQASADASALGYQSGIGDVACSQGAQEQLGLDPTIQYQAVSIYFSTREEAQQFVAMYEPGVVGTASVTAYCLD